jgi:hypothetical protein
MADQDKRRYRETKRFLKKEGNRDRRRFFKRQLEIDPNEATPEDEYSFGRNSSATMNGWHKDRKRRSQDDEEEEPTRP